MVKEGDRAKIAIGVSGSVPDKANLYLRTGEGSERKWRSRSPMAVLITSFPPPPVTSAYRVKAGDARSDWLQVRVIPPPRIEKVEGCPRVSSYLERDPPKPSRHSP